MTVKQIKQLSKLMVVALISSWISLGFVVSASAESNAGLTVEVYIYDSTTPDHEAKYKLCSTITDTAWTSVDSINANFDAEYAGIVAGCRGDFVLVHYSGYLTWDKTETATLMAIADDGFYMTLDGEPVIDDWTLKGCGGSQVQHDFVAGVPQKLDAWFYEYGGGACSTLYTLQNNQWNVIPTTAYSKTNEPQVPIIPPVIPSLPSPVNIQAKLIDATSVELTWDAPESSYPIEHYAVSWTYGGADGWGIGVWDTKTTIADLPENTEITFTVRADNDSLPVYSPVSEPIVITTSEVVPVVPPVIPPEPPVIDPVEPEPPVVDPITPDPQPKPVDEPPVPSPTPKPDPQPVEQPASNPDPAPATDFTQIDPSEIDASTLTVAEVAELIAVANETLATSEQGSPEYEQALEQLFVAAQADDIQLDPAIANIPLIGNLAGALTDSFNFVGNIGSDISPAVRAKAKKTLVSAVIVTQIATTAAAVSLASSTSSTQSVRRNK
jgi:hypothetical protein